MALRGTYAEFVGSALNVGTAEAGGLYGEAVDGGAGAGTVDVDREPNPVGTGAGVGVYVGVVARGAVVALGVVA